MWQLWVGIPVGLVSAWWIWAGQYYHWNKTYAGFGDAMAPSPGCSSCQSSVAVVAFTVAVTLSAYTWAGWVLGTVIGLVVGIALAIIGTYCGQAEGVRSLLARMDATTLIQMIAVYGASDKNLQRTMGSQIRRCLGMSKKEFQELIDSALSELASRDLD